MPTVAPLTADAMTHRPPPPGHSPAAPLGAQEHELLRRIALGGRGASPLSSTQRLRFELLGLIEDRADGVRLTARGKTLASAAPEPPPEARDVQPSDPPRDRRGRRLGLRRRSPF